MLAARLQSQVSETRGGVARRNWADDDEAVLGYIRDTPKHSVLSAVDVYDANDSGDTARVVFWEAGEKGKTKVVQYDGGL